MNARDRLPSGSQLPMDVLRDHFEAAWKAGKFPDPNAYLSSARPADRAALATALAAIDARYRARPEVAASAEETIKLHLKVTAGPHEGKEFSFDGHDTFLVGRVNDAHLQLSYDDPYFSRRHFVLEVNPPRCRLMDLQSRNGTEVNGQKVNASEIKDGDIIKAGHTHFKVSIVGRPPEHQVTHDEYATKVPTESWVPKAEPKTVLGNYEIVRELGRGGMGVVYEAKRLADGKPVALKTIIPALGASEKQIDRFMREAKVLEQLKHKNIVGFQDVGLDGEVIYLAMELVTGPDFDRILKDSGPSPIKPAVRGICQMLTGLAHAHEKGFVHRDIKPANILVHKDGTTKTTKLADFGLARAYEVSQLSGLTMQGDVGGTPMYMPPEQITHFRNVKPAADQYSAAATLYTLLTGKCIHNFPKGIEACLIHITTEHPVPIRERRSDIPKGLAEVIHTALSREPEERFEDVEEFREELVRWA